MHANFDRDHINRQLNFIASHIPSITFLSVTSVDGFPIGTWPRGMTSTISDLEYEEGVGAVSSISAAMFALGNRIIDELDAETNRTTIIKSDRGIMFLIALNNEMMLSLGVREYRTIDSVLVILQQWWGELLNLLDVPAPEL